MSSDSSRTRALLPRVLADEGAEFLSSESTSASGINRSAAATTTTAGRTNIRSACLACRRRRSKCSGGNPCSRCRALETECTYAESQDGRTRALRDRSKEELDIHKKVVTGLFRVVCERKEQPFLDLIRNNASLEDVAAAIDEFYVDFRSDSASETAEDYASVMTKSLIDRTIDNSSRYPGEEFDLMAVDKVQNEPQFLSGERAEIASVSLGHAHIPSAPPIDVSINATFNRHFLQPLHHRDTSGSTLSVVYMDFRDLARQMIGQQASLSIHILGDPNVSCTALFESSSSSGPFGVANWASATIKTIVGPDILFRLAWLCYLTRFIKWAIQPGEENFELMPQAMVPTDLQIAIPHAPIVDLLPIPQIRDLMIHRPRNFLGALQVAGATVHWTESISDAIDHNPITGVMSVSARFENHVSDINNFCFGRCLLQTFPELEGQQFIAEQDQLLSVSSRRSPPLVPLDFTMGI